MALTLSLRSLRPRRYLYNLILTDDPTCRNMRKLFLPDAGAAEPVRVCSLGGGPGFDHVTMLFLASFLCEANRALHEGAEFGAREVHTEVRDLFCDDWQPILDAIADSSVAHVPLVHQSSRGITSPCDLRYETDHEANSGGQLSIGGFDLFVFSFVLHENHSGLKTGDGEEGDLVESCLVHQILREAKAGSFVVCTDAGNRMWPCIQRAGAGLGWNSKIGGGFEPWKVKMGARSFMVMERKEEWGAGDAK
jgi:hypothetical protein